MRILVLGGAGLMGEEIVNQLISRSDVQITVADAAANKLAKLSERLGSRVDTAVVNVDDSSGLVSEMKKADAVVSAVGPYYKYATKIIESSIAAHVNMVDIDDDFDATLASLKIDAQAKKAGVTVIIGCGASPGVTNIMARYGADKLDKVDEIRLYWAESATDPAGPAAMIHWFHITSGEVPMYINGDWVNVKGLSEPEVVEFMPPLGKLEVCYTGHAEPVSLPRFIKGVKDVTIKGAVFPSRMLDVYKTLSELGFGSAETFNLPDGYSIPVRELSVRLLRALPRFAPQFFLDLYNEEMARYAGCAGATKVVVSGQKDGDPTRYTYDLMTDSVRTGTATPAAVAALLLARGEVSKRGVMAPEGAFSPASFLKELKVPVNEIETRKRQIVNTAKLG